MADTDTSTAQPASNGAAPYTATSDDEFDALIEEATLPEMPVRLCLHGNLRREYEEIKARIAERAAERDAQRTAAAAAAAGMVNDIRLATKGPEAPAVERDPEQDRLDELAAQMRAKSVTFIVRALPSKEYQALTLQHPPRKEAGTGRVDPRDYQGVNTGTFYPELVRRSIARPTMTPERWAKLDGKLTDAQFDKLANAAAEVNRKDEDLPF